MSVPDQLLSAGILSNMFMVWVYCSDYASGNNNIVSCTCGLLFIQRIVPANADFSWAISAVCSDNFSSLLFNLRDRSEDRWGDMRDNDLLVG